MSADFSFLDQDGLIEFWEKIKANFPRNNGTGASGTWGIGISGNAATATTATNYAASGGIATALAGKAASNHTHSYLPLSGGVLTGTLQTITGSAGIMLRTYPGNAYNSGIAHRTNDNEAVCFENHNSVTSWIFRTFEPTTSSGAWNDVTPSMQIKNQRVTINKLIGNDENAAYNLDVNGTLNATTIYQNGSTLASLFSGVGHTHTKSQITDFPTSMPASDVYSWAKASTKPSYSFSEISSRGEALLDWGGRSLSGNVTPIGMALSNEHSANRLAFINGDALTFEYSSDGGSTWTTYGYSASDKSRFCTQALSVPIGRASDSTSYSTSSRTRITLTAQNGTTGYVYTNPKKMLINVSSSGGLQVLVEYRKGTDYKSGGAWSTFGTYTLSGWSGWNDIPLILGTLGGGTTQTGNYWQLRLTVIVTSFSSSYPTSCYISALRIYGSNSWTSPSTMATTNHLYSFDMSQNANFPARVTATSFIGSLTGNVTGNCNGSSGSCTGNAATATKLATARTLTIGSTGKSFDGSGNVSWSLAEIGAAAASHSHSYLPLSGGTLTGTVISQNIRPDTNNTRTLGNTGYRYSEVYANRLYGTATKAYIICDPEGESQDILFSDIVQCFTYLGDHLNNTSNPHGVTKAQVGLGNVGNFKAVSTEANQGLSNTEKSNARTNIGAGTSSFSGSYNDLTNKPTIPSAVTESTVSGWGFTKNTGTVTSVAIKMNGSVKGTITTSGTIDLGTVLTSHQDISGKANASEAGYSLSVSGTSVSLKNKAGTVLSTITTQDTNTTYSASTGLTLTGTAFSVKYGTAAGTACQGNDSRLANTCYVLTSLTTDTSVFDAARAAYVAGRPVFYNDGTYFYPCTGATSSLMLFEITSGNTTGLAKKGILWNRGSNPTVGGWVFALTGSDSGWKTLSNTEASYRKVGSIVYFKGCFQLSSSSQANVAQLLSGYRPSEQTIFQVPVIGNGGPGIAAITIDTNGYISLASTVGAVDIYVNGLNFFVN